MERSIDEVSIGQESSGFWRKHSDGRKPAVEIGCRTTHETSEYAKTQLPAKSAVGFDPETLG
jgi:hypothetical protein